MKDLSNEARNNNNAAELNKGNFFIFLAGAPFFFHYDMIITYLLYKLILIGVY